MKLTYRGRSIVEETMTQFGDCAQDLVGKQVTFFNRKESDPMALKTTGPEVAAMYAAVPAELHGDLDAFVESVSNPAVGFAASGATPTFGKLLDLIRTIREMVGVTGRLPILKIIVWATSNFVPLMAAVTAQDWVGVFTILATLWPIIFPEPVPA